MDSLNAHAHAQGLRALLKARVLPTISEASSDAGTDTAPLTPRKSSRKVTRAARHELIRMAMRIRAGVTTRAMARATARLRDVVAVPATQDGWRGASGTCGGHDPFDASPCLRETPPLAYDRAMSGLAGADAMHGASSATYETPASPDMVAALECTERAAGPHGASGGLVGSATQLLGDGDAPHSDGFDAARLVGFDAALDLFDAARLASPCAPASSTPFTEQMDRYLDACHARSPDLRLLGGPDSLPLDDLGGPLLDCLNDPLLGDLGGPLLDSRPAREAGSLPRTADMDLGRASGEPRDAARGPRATRARSAALAARLRSRPAPSPRARRSFALTARRLGDAGVMVRWQEIVACLRAGTSAPSEYAETATQPLRAGATVAECTLLIAAQLQMLRGAVADGAIAKLRERWLYARIYQTEQALALAPVIWVAPPGDAPQPSLPGAPQSPPTPRTALGGGGVAIDRRWRLRGHKWAIVEHELGVGVHGLFVTDGAEGAAATWHVDDASLEGVRAWCHSVRAAQPAAVALGAALAWLVQAAVRGSRLADVGVMPLETARGEELARVSETEAAALVAGSPAS